MRGQLFCCQFRFGKALPATNRFKLLGVFGLMIIHRTGKRHQKGGPARSGKFGHG